MRQASERVKFPSLAALEIDELRDFIDLLKEKDPIARYVKITSRKWRPEAVRVVAEAVEKACEP